MNKHLLLLLLLFALLGKTQAQCPPPDYPEPADLCPDAPILTCLPLDGYCNTLGEYLNIPPIPGCSNGAFFDNADWLGFIAGSTTITIQLTPTNCYGSSTGWHGLQSVILEGSCTGQVMDNQCNCTQGVQNPYTLTSDNFIIGETYFIALDGCGSDTCHYEIAVIEGSTQSGSPEEVGDVEGLIEVCPGAITQYTIPNGNEAILTWTLTPPIGTFVGDPEGETVTIAWNSAGQAQLCPTVNNPCYTFPQPECLTITSTEIQPQHEYYDICPGECQECAGLFFCTSTGAAGTSVVLDSWMGCDSVIVCHVNQIPPSVTDLGTLTFCSPASYEICGDVYFQSGIYSATCTDFYGCDSIVNMDLAILEPFASISPPGELGCGENALLILDGLNSS